MKTFLILLIPIFLASSGAAQTTDSATTARTQITTSEFNRLLENVRNQRPDSLKAGTLKDTFINSSKTLTTAQIRKLLKEIPRDSDKLALARSAFDRVSDPDQFIKLADLFRSPTYKREFSLWVKKQNK